VGGGIPGVTSYGSAAEIRSDELIFVSCIGKGVGQGSYAGAAPSHFIGYTGAFASTELFKFQFGHGAECGPVEISRYICPTQVITSHIGIGFQRQGSISTGPTDVVAVGKRVAVFAVCSCDVAIGFLAVVQAVKKIDP